jgi:cell fate (sporulation/competence/biofilm development) regulator YlbF (YheA/YmcA/DUF963 family)
MTQSSATLPGNVLAAVERLAAGLRQSEPLAAYYQAEANLHADAASVELLERFMSAQNHLRRQQANGSLTQADMERLRLLQTQVRANTLIMAYAQSQQEALAYLPEVNYEISRLLGFDFAGIAGPSGCC